MEKVKRKKGFAWKEKISINGQILTKTCERKADAELWKNQKKREKIDIEIHGAPLIKNITLLEFSKIWFSHKPNLARRSCESYRSALSCYLLKPLGHMYLKDIKLRNAQEIMAELRTMKLSQSRIKLVRGVLINLLSDAVRWEYLQHHPLKNLDPIKLDDPDEIYWLEYEVIAFLNANRDDEHYALYVTALNTGMRIGEILGLRWSRVDFATNQIEVSCQRNREGIVNKTKNGKTLHLPMNPTLKKILLALRIENRARGETKLLDLVFCKRNGDMINTEHFSERVLKEAIKRAQVKEICFRNLRTTFAANFCMKGGDLYVLSKILNHSSVDITAKKYAHLHPSYMKKATDHISFEATSPYLATAHLQLVASD